MNSWPTRPAFGILAALRARRVVENARMAIIAGEGERACALLDEALATGAKDPDWHWLRGRAAALCNDLDGAEASYADALELDPHHTHAEKSLLVLRAQRYRPVLAAWHLHTAGRLIEASHAFAAALHNREVGPNLHPEVWTGLGWCHYGLSDAPTAAWCFQQAVALAPESAQARLGHGMACYLSGQLEEAEHSLRAAEAANPLMQEAAAFLGWCAYSKCDWPAAAAHFERAHHAQPLAADPLWGLAWAAWRIAGAPLHGGDAAFARAVSAGVLHPSRRDLAALLQADADSSALLLQYATALLDAAAPGEALLAFSTLLARGVADAGAGCARAQLQLGRHYDALATLATLPDSALDLPFTEMWADAEGMLHAVTTTPRELRSRALCWIGESALARTEAECALACNPKHGAAQLALGSALAAAGDNANALVAFQAVRGPVPLENAAIEAAGRIDRAALEPWLLVLDALHRHDLPAAQAALQMLPPKDPRTRHLAARIDARLKELPA